MENDTLRDAVAALRKTINNADTGWQLPRDVTRALHAAADRIERAKQRVETYATRPLDGPERSTHARKASSYPPDQLVYSLTSVESLIKKRIRELGGG